MIHKSHGIYRVNIDKEDVKGSKLKTCGVCKFQFKTQESLKKHLENNRFCSNFDSDHDDLKVKLKKKYWLK